MTWISVKLSELSKDEPKRAERGHSFVSPKRLPWLTYCRYCGHVPLKNAISTLVTRIGCHYEGDSRYQRWVASGCKVVPS